MDSTMIKVECIDSIACYLGCDKEVKFITERAMQGELDFTQSLYLRVKTLKGTPENYLKALLKNLPLMNGLDFLIQSLQKYHWRIAIASGGFTYFAKSLKRKLHLDDIKANELEIINGVLTGNIIGSIVDAESKSNFVTHLEKKYKISSKQTVAIGDGANDIHMMNAAHLGIAFHAKPMVLKHADACIHQKGLDCLLHWLA
jgi:phosphoserine phosphatase